MKAVPYEIENRQILHIKGDENYPLSFLDKQINKVYEIEMKIASGFYEIIIFENQLVFNLIGTYDENN